MLDFFGNSLPLPVDEMVDFCGNSLPLPMNEMLDLFGNLSSFASGWKIEKYSISIY